MPSLSTENDAKQLIKNLQILTFRPSGLYEQKFYYMTC
jgi:hypothetical protein